MTEIKAKYYTESEYNAMLAEYQDTVLIPYYERKGQRWNDDAISGDMRNDGQHLMYLTTYYGLPAVLDAIREEARLGKVNTIWIVTWLENNRPPQF